MPCQTSSAKMSKLHGGRAAIRHAPYPVPRSMTESAPLFLPYTESAAPLTPGSEASLLASPPYSFPSLSSPSMSPCSSSRASPNLETDFLDEPPAKKRSGSRKADADHVRRPPNPFIIFACEFRNQAVHKGVNNRVLSKRAGELWKHMNDGEKQNWRNLAADAKKKHEQAHPGYRYQPRRKKQRAARKDAFPMQLTFPDPPKSQEQTQDLNDADENDALSRNALYFSPASSEMKLSENTSLTDFAQRKPSSRIAGGLDAGFFSQSKAGPAMPAGATSLLPDLSNMHAFDHPYSSLQWQHYTVPLTDYIQWNAMPDLSQALWNGNMELAPFQSSATSLTGTAYQQSLFNDQNQFELPSFLGTLSA